MSKPQPNYRDLLVAILIPINVDVLEDSYIYLRNQFSSIDWLKLFNRLEGVSVLVLITGFMLLSMRVLLGNGADLSFVRSIGLQYVIGLLFLTVYSVARLTMKIVESINMGESIFGDSSNTPISYLLAKITFTILFLLVPVYAIWIFEIDVVESAMILILAFLIFGSIIAGLSCALSLIIQFSASIFS